jgi:LysR family hydrogen peroxide-inducible transcriptional activator
VRERDIAVRRLDPKRVLLLEEGHCLRSHVIAACGPRRGSWESAVQATSLYTPSSRGALHPGCPK